MLPGGRLLPPDLIIQDELHLISGPLGTMVGLYETALEELAGDERKVRPKIVASTATVRRADSQIQALFCRAQVDIFPPPGPDRRDSFFAHTLVPKEIDRRPTRGCTWGWRLRDEARRSRCCAFTWPCLAPGRNGTSSSGRAGEADNPADPYMTLVGYFNACRELGGSRRLIEDEVRTRLTRYGERKRVGEAEGLFADREIDYEPVELTSRVDTSQVSEAKRQARRCFRGEEQRGCSDRDQHDFSRSGHHSIGIDGGVRAAQDSRRSTFRRPAVWVAIRRGRVWWSRC